jgi:hypothetical protein
VVARRVSWSSCSVVTSGGQEVNTLIARCLDGRPWLQHLAQGEIVCSSYRHSPRLHLTISTCIKLIPHDGALMPVRRLKSHLNIVACGHNLIAWWPLGTYAAGDRLAGRLTQLCVERDVTTHLEKDVVVSAKEERDRVPSSTRAICCTVHGALENIICTVSVCGGDVVFHLR